MGRWLVLGLLALAAGCATDPFAQLETTTPTLTRSQVADLQKHAQTPEALGIQVFASGQGLSVAGANEVRGGGTVAVPLVKLPAPNPRESEAQYRLPVVLATVNGQEGVRVLLDSGSNRNLFGYAMARSLNIPVVAGLKPMTGMGIGGSVDNYVAVIPTFRLGGVEFQKLLAMVGPDAQALTLTRSFGGGAQVMILGVNSLRPLAYLTIDYLRGTVTFSAQDGYQPLAQSSFVTSTRLRWDGDLPAVDVSLDDRDPEPCYLDTGGDYGMLVSRSQATAYGYWKPGRGPLGTSQGVGGTSLSTSYEIKSVKIGGANCLQVPARTDLIGPEAAGGRMLLGNVVLRHYRLTFDFRNNQLWLER